MARQAVETLMAALWADGPSIIKTQVFQKYATDKDGKFKTKDGKMTEVLSGRLDAKGRGAATDIHNTGRALDIHLHARMHPQYGQEYDKTESGYGYGLVNIFLELKDSMKWETIIYDANYWSGDGTRHNRTKKSYATPMDKANYEHLSHIHIQWADNADADSSSFDQALREALSAGN